VRRRGGPRAADRAVADLPHPAARRLRAGRRRRRSGATGPDSDSSAG
jgi:hypothetical protein